MSGGTQRIHWTPDLIAKVRLGSETGMTDAEIARLLNAPRNSVVGIRYRYGIPTCHEKGTLRPVPDDFKAVAPTMTVVAASRLYKASPATVRRWHSVAVTNPLRKFGRPKNASEKRFRVAKVKKPVGRQRRAKKSPERQDSVAACAQLYLQRFFPVYRARTADPAAPNDLWIMAGRRVTEADLVSTAVRKGFQSKRLAA